MLTFREFTAQCTSAFLYFIHFVFVYLLAFHFQLHSITTPPFFVHVKSSSRDDLQQLTIICPRAVPRDRDVTGHQAYRRRRRAAQRRTTGNSRTELCRVLHRYLARTAGDCNRGAAEGVGWC